MDGIQNILNQIHVNEDGQRIMELHHLYHSANQPEAAKQAFLACALTWLKGKGASELFLADDPDALLQYMTKQKQFQFTAESLAKELVVPVEQYLYQKDVSFINVSVRQKPGRFRKMELIIERRVGTKASIMEDMSDCQDFSIKKLFDAGHMKALFSAFVLPALQKHMDLVNFSTKTAVAFEVVQDRKYRVNVCVRFIIPLDALKESSEELDYVAEKLQMLNDIVQRFPVLY